MARIPAVLSEGQLKELYRCMPYAVLGYENATITVDAAHEAATVSVLSVILSSTSLPLEQIPAPLSLAQLGVLRECLPGVRLAHVGDVLIVDVTHKQSALDALCAILPVVQEVAYPKVRKVQHQRSVRNAPEPFVLTL